MVHDPRVSSLLSRLGGLYRDPSRVDRDASSLLKSAVGNNLNPGIAALVENTGETSNCLVLQGTIALVYRGQTYQQLVDIYMSPGYPIRPPVTYVRLAPNMYLKENHPHVGSDGMVYMPYTHEWNQRTSSLIEMVVAMSSVFSADPPVYSRAAPPSTPAPAPAATSQPPPPAYSENIISSKTKSSADSERFIQEQMREILEREAAEANRAAEVARRAALEDDEREKEEARQKAWKEQRKIKLQGQLNRKVAAYLSDQAKMVKSQVEGDWRDQFRLEESKEAIDDEVEYFKNTKESLQAESVMLDKKTAEIKEWLEEAQNTTAAQEIDVDDLCKPASTLHAQMMELAAENAALTDALYFLDRAMYMGQVDCTTHLKSVRKLAKRQFLVRAHLIKINQALMGRADF